MDNIENTLLVLETLGTNESLVGEARKLLNKNPELYRVCEYLIDLYGFHPLLCIKLLQVGVITSNFGVKGIYLMLSSLPDEFKHLGRNLAQDLNYYRNIAGYHPEADYLGFVADIARVITNHMHQWFNKYNL